MKHLSLASAIVLLLAGSVAICEDWPQWRGINRDGNSGETGLLKSWPAGGPKLLWTTTEDMGKAFSSVAVAKGTIYTTGALASQGWLFAYDLNGKLKWKVKYGPEFTRAYPSARTTPTIDGQRIYVMSGLGRIVCFEAPGGRRPKIKWTVDTAKVFGGKNIQWGIAESVLIHENMAICTPGGPSASLVALDKMTGKTVWRTLGLSDKSAYCSPIVVTEGRKNLVVTVTESNVVGVSLANGRVLWRHRYQGRYRAHPNSPLYRDGQVYVTSGYDEGGLMLKLSDDGTAAKVLWRDKVLDVHHGGVVLVGGYIYGASWRGNRDGNWVCLDWKTGRRMYETKWENKGQIIYADGMLYLYEEKGGMVGLARATPRGLKVVSSFRITQGSGQHWAHPAIAGGRLYIRRGRTLMAYQIKAE